MPYIAIRDLSLYYEEAGSGIPVILLHGATGSIDPPNGGWSRFMPTLAHQYHVIAIEHRGHGRTNNPQGYLTYSMIADDIVEFILKQQLSSAHILGISDGAIVALHLAMFYPERVQSVVALGANYWNDDQVREANRFADLDRIDREHPTWVEEIRRIHDRHKYPGYWRELLRQLAENLAVNPQYTVADLERISVPTLLMAGEHDLWANLDQMYTMRRSIPGAEMLIVNNGGHLINLSHPHIVEPVISDFLQRHS